MWGWVGWTAVIPQWYHSGMAMTLRTTQQHDDAIARLAEREGISKNEAVLRAVERADQALSIDEDVMAAYARASVEYREALDRLGSV